MMNRNCIALAGVVVLASAVSVSSAGDPAPPALTVDLSIGDSMQQLMPSGVAGKTGYLYERDFMNDAFVVEVDGGDISLGWSMLADPDMSRGAGGPVSLMAGITLQNNTGVTQTISLLATLPISSALAPSTLIGGSASGTLTADIDGGTMSNVNGADPMYRAYIDGSALGGVADLFPFDSSISATPFSSASTGFSDFGQPIPSSPGPAVNTSIGILLQFDVSPGELIGWTSNFVVQEIPTPGSAAFLAIAGLFASQRRRR